MLYSIRLLLPTFLVPKINVPQKMQWHMFLQFNSSNSAGIFYAKICARDYGSVAEQTYN